MAPNVYWKSTIDFRDFDISVPSFNFGNNVNRNVDGYVFDDQITLIETSGSGENNSFLGSGITRIGQTITSGTLNMYVDNRSGGFDGYILIDGNPSASAMNSIIDSVSRTDDISFLRSLLSGADEILLSVDGASNDYVFAANGADSLYGGGGRDTLLGDAGTDLIFGAGGSDSLLGGQRSDTLYGGRNGDSLFGGSSADSLYGGAQADFLAGDGGNDTLAGGAGPDQFAFRANTGDDTVIDWQDNVDRIRIETNIDINVSINYTGPDALVMIAALDITILIEDVANSSLSLSQQGNLFFLT
jgi:Ca2+-binding RTX toxin-like protein